MDDLYNNQHIKQLLEEIFEYSEDDSLIENGDRSHGKDAHVPDSKKDEIGNDLAEDSNDSMNYDDIDIVNQIEGNNYLNYEKGPKPGMLFPNINNLFHAYKLHGALKRFNIAKKSTSKDKSGYYKYKTINCDRKRKAYIERLSKRIKCPPRISAVIKGGVWMVSK
ncbi:conserved hypothetical protein [Ricinus communis]|uniref:FAR1 domain-containing protein n=1 Tax=Ricinus communis TaxID=3988 RepID=B9SZX3_RICCO|nr:conserved hypothetical protein [Ricinus communis]